MTVEHTPQSSLTAVEDIAGAMQALRMQRVCLRYFVLMQLCEGYVCARATEVEVEDARKIGTHLKGCMTGCMRVYASVRACVHACMRACMHVCMHACPRARVPHVPTCLRACVPASVAYVMWVAAWLGGCVAGWSGWLGGWVAGWLGGWVAGWLGGWVAW